MGEKTNKQKPNLSSHSLCLKCFITLILSLINVFETLVTQKAPLRCVLRRTRLAEPPQWLISRLGYNFIPNEPEHADPRSALHGG